MMQRLSLNWHNQLKVIRTVTTVGQRERATQQRVVRFFIEELGYRYLGDWHTRPNNRNVELKWSTKTGHRVRVFPVSVF